MTKNNNNFLIFLLLASPFASSSFPTLVGRDLKGILREEQQTSFFETTKNRKLQSCSDIKDVFQFILKEGGLDDDKVKCTIVPGSEARCNVVCTSVKYCCDEFCATLEQSVGFDADLEPVYETSCRTVVDTEDNPLNGQTFCTRFDYSSCVLDEDDLEPCGCAASINGTRCASCTVCGGLPGTNDLVVSSASDCSNISGGESVSMECSDIDTIAEVEALTLQCKNPTFHSAGADNYGPSRVVVWLTALITGFTFFIA